jgi:hypothetical protein
MDIVTEPVGGRADQIMSEREDLGLVAICLAVILLSIGGIVADVVTSLLPGMDGLLLLLVCLMMIVIFSPPLVALVKEELALRTSRKSTAPADPPQGAKEGK